MSTYVRHKVLRIPLDKINMSIIREELQAAHPEADIDDDFTFYLESTLPELFDYATPGKFQTSPTEDAFIDFMLEYEYDCDGEWGKVRNLYPTEKERFISVFKQLDPDVNMDHVRLVEYCWYNATEAPSYYDPQNDDFYEEVTTWKKK